jgi:hypothetical protein
VGGDFISIGVVLKVMRMLGVGKTAIVEEKLGDGRRGDVSGDGKKVKIMEAEGSTLEPGLIREAISS